MARCQQVCKLVIETPVGQRITEMLRAFDLKKLRQTIVKDKSPRCRPEHDQPDPQHVQMRRGNDLLDRRLKFGTGFKPPSQAVLRKHRNTQPNKPFTAPDALVPILQSHCLCRLSLFRLDQIGHADQSGHCHRLITKSQVGKRTQSQLFSVFRSPSTLNFSLTGFRSRDDSHPLRGVVLDLRRSH